MDITQTVRTHLVENFLFGDDSRLADTTSFLQSGIIDSTGILELTEFLEQTFGIRIEDQEMIPDNLDSLANVTLFVTAKLARSGQKA